LKSRWSTHGAVTLLFTGIEGLDSPPTGDALTIRAG
jgi:hypothetical protein